MRRVSAGDGSQQADAAQLTPDARRCGRAQAHALASSHVTRAPPPPRPGGSPAGSTAGAAGSVVTSRRDGPAWQRPGPALPAGQDVAREPKCTCGSYWKSWCLCIRGDGLCAESGLLHARGPAGYASISSVPARHSARACLPSLASQYLTM